jgi:phosphoadenosine phosphosulfate reductase
MVKICPLLDWNSKKLWEYAKEHGLPYHPLWEKGYLSIGCSPECCTRPVLAGEDPRAGRWAGKNKIECGIHAADSSQSPK